MSLNLAHAGERFTFSSKMKKNKKCFTGVSYRKLDERSKENEALWKKWKKWKKGEGKKERMKYRKSVLLCVTDKIIENLDFTVITYKWIFENFWNFVFKIFWLKNWQRNMLWKKWLFDEMKKKERVQELLQHLQWWLDGRNNYITSYYWLQNLF